MLSTLVGQSRVYLLAKRDRNYDTMSFVLQLMIAAIYLLCLIVDGAVLCRPYSCLRVKAGSLKRSCINPCDNRCTHHFFVEDVGRHGPYLKYAFGDRQVSSTIPVRSSVAFSSLTQFNVFEMNIAKHHSTVWNSFQ